MGRETKEKMTRTGLPQMEPNKTYVNPEANDQMEIKGFRLNSLKQAFTWFVILLTIGFLRLVFYWCPDWMVLCTHDQCSLADAEVVLLKDQYLQWFVARIWTATREGTKVKVLSREPTMFYSKSRADSNTPLNKYKKDETLFRCFVTKKVKYIWDYDKQEFQKLRGLEENVHCSFFHNVQGLSIQDQERRRVLYGMNVAAVHVTPIIVLLFKEVLSPFYIFQVFSCSLWYADEYEYYASAIVLISTLSIVTTIYQSRKMQRALRNTISSSTIVTIWRGGDVYDDICSEDLVPGDVIEIPRHGCVMQCDAVLVSGNCIVNESMLTGESVPVTKTPLPNTRSSEQSEELIFNMKDHSRHVLFSGTHVIQTRYYGNHKVKAVVIRTGFSTAKGELVRSILYPKPVDFKFNRDTYIFVGVLAGIALVGFIYTVVLMVQRENDAGDIVQRSLDLITITVPPALPAALTVGIVFAQSRLKHSMIYCISPRSINVSGSINVVCFDKTGTLTEDGLNIHSVVPVSGNDFDGEIFDMSKLSQSNMIVGMASCHSLTIINGELTGDPLDLIMFNVTDWNLEEPGQEDTRFDMIVPTVVSPKSSKMLSGMNPEIGIVRQFTFSSSLQRMSVIVRRAAGSNFDLYTKGAPEMIMSLSKSETVPGDFKEVLSKYTQQGYRVIAMAWKPLPEKLNYVKAQRINRDQVEKELYFLGLLVMENKLKPETMPVIQQLHEANIRTVMVTGDNMLTALSVARECGMVGQKDQIIAVHAYPPDDGSKAAVEYMFTDGQDQFNTQKTTKTDTLEQITINLELDNPYYHFAVTGKSWAVLRQYFTDLIPKVVVRGTVFARMLPEQKAQLVEELQETGYYVSMCGDGANDCGALKMAHAGISLSEAEASVASPFTSKQPNIECVPTLIREGRSALVTSVGIFKYMACYSLTQFCSVLLLYWVGANLTDFQFLHVDLICITTLAVTFGWTPAYHVLVKELPVISLITFGPILSLFLQMMVQVAVQVIGFFYVQEQPWFVPFVPNEDDDYASHMNTVVFIISSFQYVLLAFVFSKGAPYRKTILSNYWFLGNLLLLVALNVWMAVYPIDGLETFLEMKSLPSVPFRLTLVGMVVANCFLSAIIETFFIETNFVKKTCQEAIDKCFSRPDYQYINVENEIRSRPDWPPVSASIKSQFVTSQKPDSSHKLTPDSDRKTDYDSEGSRSSGSLRRIMTVDKRTRQIRSSPLSRTSAEHDKYVTHSDEVQLIDNKSDDESVVVEGFTNVSLSIDDTDVGRKSQVRSETVENGASISTQL